MTNTGSAFTVDSVLAELRVIALAANEANGGSDFSYVPTLAVGSSIFCFYSHGDTPGCLIGIWLYRNDVSLTELSTFEGLNVADFVYSLFPQISPFVVELLTHVQMNQDQGYPWLSIVDTELASSQSSS